MQVSLSSTQQLCALGALLAILQKHDLLAGGGGGEDDGGGGQTPLMSVESISEARPRRTCYALPHCC